MQDVLPLAALLLPAGAAAVAFVDVLPPAQETAACLAARRRR